ncbi:MAG: PEP-CTERM sorting domain-containing protein [Planctomycetia bacterium]|nr:PEP-CTERM sorting domain-containing protein [Planctomycetia bacterium]
MKKTGSSYFALSMYVKRLGVGSLLGLSSLIMAGQVKAEPVIYYTGVYDGTGTDYTTNEAAKWRTDSVAKSFDGDGNNIYGSNGFLHTTILGSWDAGYPDWKYGGTSAQVTGTYQIDHPGNPSTSAGAGYARDLGSDFNQAGIYADNDLSHVRIGVINDLGTKDSDQLSDNSTMKLQVLSSNNSDAQVLTEYTVNLNSALNDGKADVYFFDVVDLKKGQKIRIVGDKYAGSMFVDKVTHAGNGQTEFTGSFTNNQAMNYFSPTKATKTLMHRDNGVFSTVGIETTAKDGAVNGLTFSMLEKDTSYFLTTTDASGKMTTRGLVVDGSQTAKVLNDLPNFASLEEMKLIEYTGGISVGNGNILVDFQGVNPTGGQVPVPVTATEGGVWNAFEFQAHSGTPTKDPSMALVDSAGNMTSVKLTVLGDVTGWAGYSEYTPLTTDYMFTFAGNSKKPLDFEITGLNPDEMYELEILTSYNTDRNSWFKINGDERNVKGSEIWYLSPDELGKIVGIFGSTNGGEANWAGLRITSYDPNAVPEPTTWALLLMGVGGILGSRRFCRKEKK